MPEQKQEKQISAAAIKYLIAMGGLCGKDGKIRSVDIAEKSRAFRCPPSNG